MKKIISAALSICIALCAAGCGGENVSRSDEKNNISAESKTEISFTGQAADQPRSDTVITMMQSETETARQTQA